MIGVIDSGVGGLSVWREIVSLLPDESTIYIADSKNCPYGEKSYEEIYNLTKRLITFLIQKEVKLIVIACNTMTVTSIARLRQEFPDMRIVGTVPVIKVAAVITKTKRIGILATEKTAESDYQKQLIVDFAKDCVVINEGTNALVPLVERGEIEGQKVEATLQHVLFPFQKEEIDVLALGCTHFPFFRPVMQEIVGDGVVILDSGEAIARQVERILLTTNTMAPEGERRHTLYTTGNEVQFRAVAKKLLDGTMSEEVQVITLAI
jgi:glutamate racemase